MLRALDKDDAMLSLSSAV